MKWPIVVQNCTSASLSHYRSAYHRVFSFLSLFEASEEETQVLAENRNGVMQEMVKIKWLMSGRSSSLGPHETQHDRSCCHIPHNYFILNCSL